MDAVLGEAKRARDRYGDFTSTHEAYGVLAEEVSELLDAIRANELDSVEKEAIQVAAVAMRLARQCATPSNAFSARSGGDAR
jgi:NTP pyrophosphatase (non-canonical NTP hydrolase)